ncbi:hypothetical protein BN1723_004029 [Verticillium longisporum]|uniref:Uncharacterized protein n=1 Tax=Verticillium longisporum TaxID=100787 RepID=A0A0G4MJ83_VERLO|nr:hypothetical protein BN1708_005252 [Verticillium longisporum]CRK34358.1 hypothetical protein BN1723_004029 [Verticillium longisporum]
MMQAFLSPSLHDASDLAPRRQRTGFMLLADMMQFSLEESLGSPTSALSACPWIVRVVPGCAGDLASLEGKIYRHRANERTRFTAFAFRLQVEAAPVTHVNLLRLCFGTHQLCRTNLAKPSLGDLFGRTPIML